jgi:phosphoribosylamine--glycine ligase
MNQINREILVPIVDGMNRNSTAYKGVLYAGIMVTAGGPRVLEFNVRFGDPEAQPILARLKSDLLEVLLATCDGKLDKITLEWDRRPAVCLVMASGGYPGSYEKGKKI